MNSQGFRRYIESVDEIHKKLSDLQREERKDHEKVWKKENAILEKLRDTYVNITTGIDTVMDGQELLESTEKSKYIDEAN